MQQTPGQQASACRIGGAFWNEWRPIEMNGGGETDPVSADVSANNGAAEHVSPSSSDVSLGPSPPFASSPSPRQTSGEEESPGDLDFTDQSSVALSEDGQKNLRSFLKAIGQSKLALPTLTEDRMKVLGWLGAAEELLREQSDPAFVRRNAHNQQQHFGGGTRNNAELIRKWSTKSNSSCTGELVRTLREQFGGRSAGNIAKGRSASSSCSRPLLGFLVQQSDSAIGSSLGGSCSFLPPPPPYRPPRPATAGSDGAISTVSSGTAAQQQQQRRQEQGKDFTSLLGFDCIAPTRNSNNGTETRRTSSRSGSDEKQQRKGRTQLQQLLVPVPAVGERNGGRREGPNQPSLSPSPSMSASCSDFPELQERIQRLQFSRDSLSLQVAVLSRQVALQREKIHDLESLLESRRSSGNFHYGGHEMTQQLAELRQKYAALEREKLDAERRLRMSNSELERISQPSPQNNDGARVAELERLQVTVQRLLADNEQKESLIQSLRSALGEQQMRHSSSARTNGHSASSGRESAFAQMDINEQIRRLLLDDDEDLECAQQQMAHSLSFPANLSASHSFASCASARPPSVPATRTHQLLPASSSFSSALAHQPAMPPPVPHLWQRVSVSPPTIPPHFGTAHLAELSHRNPSSPLARQLAAELDELRRSGVVGSNNVLGRPYSSASLPRSVHSKANSLGPPPPLHGQGKMVAGQHQFGESPFVDWVRRRVLGQGGNAKKKRSRSTPNLLGPAKSGDPKDRADTESDDEFAARTSTARTLPPASGSQPSSSSVNGKQFKRGRRARSTLRSFLGRFAHRGNSLQDLRPSPRSFPSIRVCHSPFSRPSPAPSSAGGNGQQVTLRPPVRLFVGWDRVQCTRWLSEAGFGEWATGDALAVHSGRHLLSMGDADLERELGIRNALQRKRLRTMLDRIERSSEQEPADGMDTNEVMLWLDQIGLPQLRDVFAACRMDGHLLLALSAQDLVEMGINSALNHASLARSIQFLRSVDFRLHRIEQHLAPDALSRVPIPAEVEAWGHGCTVEWLRSVDLAEFTPNLAFSGLNGALMVYEPTFTAESLAEMLQMPANKTLLRRHLTAQFNSLLGQQVIGHKRDVLGQPMVTHLTPNLRIRLAKKGFSLSRKKSRSDIFVEPQVRVCPAEASVVVNGRANGAAAAGEEMSDV